MTGARFTHYPIHRLVSVMENLQDAVAVRLQLLEKGFSPSAVAILSGERGLRIFDPDGSRHGRLGRFVRSLQQVVTEEDQRFQDEILEALQKGQYVLSVAAEEEQQRLLASAIIRDRSQRRIYYFGRWTTEEMQPTVNPFQDTLRTSGFRTRALLFLGSEASAMRERVTAFLDGLSSDTAAQPCWEALQNTLQHIAVQRQQDDEPDAQWLTERILPEVDAHAILEEFRMGLQESESFAMRFVESLVEVLGTLTPEQRQQFVQLLWDDPSVHGIP